MPDHGATDLILLNCQFQKKYPAKDKNVYFPFIKLEKA